MITVSGPVGTRQRIGFLWTVPGGEGWCERAVAVRWALENLHRLVHGLVLAASFVGIAAAQPTADDAVITSVAPSGRSTSNERTLRQQLQSQPGDVNTAVLLATLLLNQAQQEGDPRSVGQALAVLQPWPDAATAPIPVLMLRANLQQHVHDFDAARKNLETLVARQPSHAQAWLTLATLHRVQGRIQVSTEACHAVQRAGEIFYAQACLAENAGLLGRTRQARAVLNRLLADTARTAAQRAWLLTTLAELEARSLRPLQAERAYQKMLASSPDIYGRISYADFLLFHKRPAEVLRLLREQPRSDAVLLRLSAADVALKAAAETQNVRELRRRMQTVNDVADEKERLGHAREQAMFALWVQGDAKTALAHARLNLSLQREPIDLLLMAQAAKAIRQSPSLTTKALKEVAELKKEMGLHDERLDALL